MCSKIICISLTRDAGDCNAVVVPEDLEVRLVRPILLIKSLPGRL